MNNNRDATSSKDSIIEAYSKAGSMVAIHKDVIFINKINSELNLYVEHDCVFSRFVILKWFIIFQSCLQQVNATLKKFAGMFFFYNTYVDVTCFDLESLHSI